VARVGIRGNGHSNKQRNQQHSETFEKEKKKEKKPETLFTTPNPSHYSPCDAKPISSQTRQQQNLRRDDEAKLQPRILRKTKKTCAHTIHRPYLLKTNGTYGTSAKFIESDSNFVRFSPTRSNSLGKSE
jgi:hypothetical protein